MVKFIKVRETDSDPVQDLNLVVEDTKLLMNVAARILNKYGGANEILGNEKIAEEFFSLSEAFEEMSDRLAASHNREYLFHINNSIKASERNMGAMLSGLLKMNPGDDVKTSLALSLLEANFDVPSEPGKKI